MRKYHQLLLLIISCCSLIVLLIYKNENQRLKYVLRVVNFFGRNDAAMQMQLSNSSHPELLHDYAHPLPVWWSIASDFHAYAAFWSRNELVAGGEAVALVVGKRGAIINFQCALRFRQNKVIKGKFKFQRMEEGYHADAGRAYTVYRYFCKLQRDFGTPTSLLLEDLHTKQSQELLLRPIKPKDTTNKPQLELLNVCVDMVDYNASLPFHSDAHLLQFLLYHQALGVNSFLIYNGDALSGQLRQLLQHWSLNMVYLPFNFPFPRHNASDSLRQIVESDCLLRNTNAARYVLLLQPHEFFYADAPLRGANSVLLHLNTHFAASEHKRFALNTFHVCLDDKQRFLMDNKYYDPEVKSAYNLLFYRPSYNAVVSSATEDNDVQRRQATAAVPLSHALVHRYIECSHIGSDGLHEWRNTLRESFMQNLKELRLHLMTAEARINDAAAIASS